MRRPILVLIFGIFCTALVTAAISVYLFHDVDKDQIGHLNQAFGGLCLESGAFALMIGGAVGLAAWIGGILLHLKGCSPRARLGLYLGVGVAVIQYPWDLGTRWVLPRFAQSSLLVFIVVAITSCTIVLLRDCYKQRRVDESI